MFSSTGSVVPIFKKQYENNQPITVTDPSMTRFCLTFDDAINLIDIALFSEIENSLFVLKAKSILLADLVEAFCQIYNKRDVIEIGPKYYEKTHETIISAEEMSRARDYGKFFVIGKDLVLRSEKLEAYSSDKPELLSVEEIKELILKCKE